MEHEETSVKLANDTGVVWSKDHNEAVVYRLLPNGQGGTKVEVFQLGHKDPFVASAELREAIQADMRKRGLA